MAGEFLLYLLEQKNPETVSLSIMGSEGAMTILVLFGILYILPLWVRFSYLLEWQFCEEEEKKGFDNSSSMHILSNLEGE